MSTKTFFSKNGRICRTHQSGVTFLELLITIVLLALITLAVFQIFGDYVYRSRRLSKMTYSNQSIENLRAMIFRDMRAATRFFVSDDGTRLYIECAIDEAAVRDNNLDKNNELSQQWNSYIAGSIAQIFDGSTGIEKVDSDPDITNFEQGVYYPVVYTFTFEDVYTTQFPLNEQQLAQQPANTINFDSKSGLWHIRRGIVTRSGPTFDPKTGSSSYEDYKKYVNFFSEAQPQSVVSTDWLYIVPQNTPNATKVFEYWRPDNKLADQDNALGIKLRLSSRDIFTLGARDSGYQQEFETFITSRTRR